MSKDTHPFQGDIPRDTYLIFGLLKEKNMVSNDDVDKNGTNAEGRNFKYHSWLGGESFLTLVSTQK